MVFRNLDISGICYEILDITETSVLASTAITPAEKGEYTMSLPGVNRSPGLPFQ